MAASTKAGQKDNPAMSFVMLSESQVTPPLGNINGKSNGSNSRKTFIQNDATPVVSDDANKHLSSQIETTNRLFEILSARSDIDHPICSECTELILSGLQGRLVASCKERDAYITFLMDISNSAPTSSEIKQTESDLASAKVIDEKTLRELEVLEREKATLEDEIADLDAESRALDHEEQNFWRSRNAFTLQMSSFQDTKEALNASYDHDAQQLERLRRTNVYNDTFCIGHDGYFGTINGLRLGRLPPPQNVEWAEINAAWGATALLLATVADKLGFSFRGYDIKPLGSTSRIAKHEYLQSSSIAYSTASTRTAAIPASQPVLQHDQQPKVTLLELYSSGDLPLGRTFLHRRFNDAMVAFLECLRQLGEFVENGGFETTSASKQSRGPKQPYKILKDKIGDVSIKLGTSQDEAWTRACKYTLTCCKLMLAHASSASNPENTTGGRRESSLQ